MTSDPTVPTLSMDLRSIAPRERHSLIFARFDALLPGQALELVNDHNPKPLRHQFEDRAPGAFIWSYLDAGPKIWRVRIEKCAAGLTAEVGDSCCSGGACCG